MSKVWLSIRFSGVGVMLASVGSAITGCSAEDAIKALLIWLALALGGGGGEETSTDGGGGGPTEIVMFTAGTHNGDLKGAFASAREGADAFCQDAVVGFPRATGANVHAFISIDEDDELSKIAARGVPQTSPIVGPTGTIIADDLADLLDGSIDASLFTAVVLPDATFWFSASTQFGEVTGNSCFGWTESGGIPVLKGSAIATDGDWLSFGNASCDDSDVFILCIAYHHRSIFKVP